MPTIPAATTTFAQNAWSPQDHYVERLMDNAAFSAAHPDDTMVLIGPPRLTGANLEGLEPVGMLQNFSMNQARPFQPMMAIGSGRQFFLGGKAQGSAQIGRLFVNGQNLLRKLYNNYKDLDPSAAKFSEPAAASKEGNFMINLDSELFLIPFGLGCVIGDKSRKILGAFYMELCVIPTYTMGIAAGQSMILEAVTVLFDRVVPMENANIQGKFEQWNSIMANGMSNPTDYNTALKSNTIGNIIPKV